MFLHYVSIVEISLGPLLFGRPEETATAEAIMFYSTAEAVQLYVCSATLLKMIFMLLLGKLESGCIHVYIYAGVNKLLTVLF